MGTLSIELFGKELGNPVMNASGTLGYGKEIEPLWSIDALGAYVTKGLSLKPHHGNPPPRIWEERHGLINSIGLQNIGLKRFFSEYFPFFQKKQTPVIVNFFGFTEEEYLECARAIGTDELIVALEMNLSCPNVKKGGMSFGKDPDMVHMIIKEAKKVTTIPLVAKLTPEVKNILEVATAAFEAGAQGITVINTVPSAAVDIQQRMIPIKGGLSGPTLRPIALRAVEEISRALPVPVFGVGGIMDYEDALSFFMAGASAVQVGTATFIDPYTIPRIIESLNTYLERKGIKNIKEIVGTAHAQS